jgi:hypothetical protein
MKDFGPHAFAQHGRRAAELASGPKPRASP